MDTGFIAEIVEAKGLVVKVVVVYKADDQVVGVTQFDDGLN